MIALCIIAYIVFGFLLSMVGTFLLKRVNEWDNGWKDIMILCIIFWPIHIIAFIIGGMVVGLSAFYDWFAGCINKKDKEE